MAFLGKIVTGSPLTLAAHTTDSSGVPAAPAAAPTARIMDATGSQLAIYKLPVVFADRDDSGVLNYSFIRRVRSPHAGNGHATILYQWTESGVSRFRFDNYISDDGDGESTQGQITGLFAHPRPGAKAVIADDEAGGIVEYVGPS